MTNDIMRGNQTSHYGVKNEGVGGITLVYHAHLKHSIQDGCHYCIYGQQQYEHTYQQLNDIIGGG